MRFIRLQDSGRLRDFDYSDQDIDSLRKQMRLPEPEPQSPGSSLSDEIGALGMSCPANACIYAHILRLPESLHLLRTSTPSLPHHPSGATPADDQRRSGAYLPISPPSAKRTMMTTTRKTDLLRHASRVNRPLKGILGTKRMAAQPLDRGVESRNTV